MGNLILGTTLKPRLHEKELIIQNKTHSKGRTLNVLPFFIPLFKLFYTQKQISKGQ